MTNRRALVPVFGIVAAVLGVALLIKVLVSPHPEHPEGGGTAQTGQILPSFDLHPFDPATQKASTAPISSLKGAKVVLMNFWASWCGPCLVEIPSLLKLREKYKDHGLELALINIDETPQTSLPRLLKRFRIDFPTYIDQNLELSELFDVQAIPMSVIIDSQRKVLFIEQGDRDWNASEVHERMNQWLSSAS